VDVRAYAGIDASLRGFVLGFVGTAVVSALVLLVAACMGVALARGSRARWARAAWAPARTRGGRCSPKRSCSA
jgi:hypothetical protein